MGQGCLISSSGKACVEVMKQGMLKELKKEQCDWEVVSKAKVMQDVVVKASTIASNRVWVLF